MAGFILCRSKYADKPYYINNMAINIYSMEELCYYIYNNIYLIGTDLVDEGLINYIETCLMEPELAKQLEFLTSQNAGLSELVITILRYVDYYTEDEIAELKGVIDMLDTQNALERLKSRADNFLNSKRYESAIHNYGLIVYGKRDKTLSDEFYGDVWHNMGVAYSKLFSFKKATECFSTAYELNHREESQRTWKASAFMDVGYEGMDEADELMYVVSKEVETLLDHAPMESEYQDIREAIILKDEGKILDYYKNMDALLKRWKSEYRNYIK
jgi:tetratricopeptide (TPR) repeat protein